VAIDRDVDPRGTLVVFFPGTGGVPEQYQRFPQHAASLGYHAIALRYANDLSLNFQICGDSPDPDCFSNARTEILTGLNLHPFLDVSPADSAINRLARLLETLETTRPDEGWGAFLTADGEPVWDSIVAAGHSQGGGHSAFLATMHELGGVVLFAGGPDFSAFYQSFASWMEESVTPPARYAGFAHTLDSFTAFRNSWTLFGMDDFGPLVNVDAIAPPYAGSPRLFTSAPPGPDPQENWPHNMIIVDAQLPVSPEGENPYEPVWTHMLDVVTSRCAPDFNGDRVVDARDLALLLTNWSGTGEADLDGDAVVATSDLALLLTAWGPCEN